jgi:Do/DeqQ family serine protease
LALSLGVVACQWTHPAASSAEPPPGDTVKIAQAAPDRVLPSSRAQVQLSYAAVAAKASPAVVNVYAQRVVVDRSIYADPILRQFGLGLGVPQERVQQSLGSGVIVRADGVIVTNHHVVEHADQLKVVLGDRREYDAKLLLDDARSDLAVLRIDTKGERLPTLAFANTRAAHVGDLVLAIGNPFGLSQTVTSGIISALARTEVGINDYAFFIQTDAAINKGNSGGALVDMSGDLVGINTAIFSESGGSNGIGFAIPAEMVRRVVESAVAGGKIVRAWLGVKAQPVTQQLARSLGLSSPRGVLVSEVYPNGPAAKAGLQRGDVVLSVNGVEVVDEQGMRYQAATARPGSAIPLQIIHGGARRDIAVRAEAPPRTVPADVRTFSGSIPLDGAQVANLSPAEAEEVGFDPFTAGVYIKAMSSSGAAARLSLRPGDIIREVNGQKINSTADLDRVMRTPASGWRIVFERGGATGVVNVQL